MLRFVIRGTRHVNVYGRYVRSTLLALQLTIVSTLLGIQTLVEGTSGHQQERGRVDHEVGWD